MKPLKKLWVLNYKVEFTNEFKRGVKLARKQGKDLKKLNFVIRELKEGKILDEKYRDHQLKGDYKGCHECHIEPDWLLIYDRIESKLIILMLRTCTHADLKKKNKG